MSKWSILSNPRLPNVLPLWISREGAPQRGVDHKRGRRLVREDGGPLELGEKMCTPSSHKPSQATYGFEYGNGVNDHIQAPMGALDIRTQSCDPETCSAPRSRPGASSTLHWFQSIPVCHMIILNQLAASFSTYCTLGKRLPSPWRPLSPPIAY